MISIPSSVNPRKQGSLSATWAVLWCFLLNVLMGLLVVLLLADVIPAMLPKFVNPPRQLA